MCDPLCHIVDHRTSKIVPGSRKGTQRVMGKICTCSLPCLNCISCGLMRKGEVFKHPTTNEEFKLKHHITSTTDWVVYVMWCPCNLLYVGETKCEFKVRLNNHRYTIRKKRGDLPVSKHFLEAGPTERDLRFMLLEHILQPPGVVIGLPY